MYYAATSMSEGSNEDSTRTVIAFPSLRAQGPTSEQSARCV